MHNSFYSDEYYDEHAALCHYGVKGMHWGIRRTPEQLGHPPSIKQPNKVVKYQKKIAAGVDKVIKKFKRDMEDMDGDRKAYIDIVAAHKSEAAKAPKDERDFIVDDARDDYDTGVFVSSTYHLAHFDYTVAERAKTIFESRSKKAGTPDEVKRSLEQSVYEAVRATPIKPFDDAYKADVAVMADSVYKTAKAAGVTYDWADPRDSASKETLGVIDDRQYSARVAQKMLDESYKASHKMVQALKTFDQIYANPWTIVEDASRNKKYSSNR